MTLEPLVVTTRESAVGTGRSYDPHTVENVHFGSIAVVSVDGGLVRWAGDPHRTTFTRSTLKPFQALPFVRDGGPGRFGWSSRQVALMCASHSGEPVHTEVVSGMLVSADCSETDLQCGCHVPGWYAALGQAAPEDARWSPIQNNCSGKHAGFLAACRMHDEPVDTYLASESGVQRRVVAAIADLGGSGASGLPSGPDGCSAPNLAMPLSRLAYLYAQLAQGRAAAREGDSLEVLFDAMTHHPELVSGTRRSDRALMSRAQGDWVTKIGADGVQAIGVRSAGIGIAIKIGDGNRDALYRVVVEVLQQLDLMDARVESESDVNESMPWLRTTLRNARGTQTGRILPTFELHAR